MVSHGAAIRLTAAVLADVHSTFALDHHLANAEFVVLTPQNDGRWTCEQWGEQTPPFDPVPRRGGLDLRPDGLTALDRQGR